MTKVNTEELLSDKEIDVVVNEIMGSIKNNEFPIMKMKCTGVPRQLTELTGKELEQSAKLIIGEEVENS